MLQNELGTKLLAWTIRILAKKTASFRKYFSGKKFLILPELVHPSNLKLFVFCSRKIEVNLPEKFSESKRNFCAYDGYKKYPISVNMGGDALAFVLFSVPDRLA